MSSKSVVNFTARRVSYETPLPLAEVIARLDKEINKAGGGPEVFHLLRTAKVKSDLEEGFNTLTQGRNFVHFLDNPYHNWMSAYTGNANTPATYVYVFGNPLIAQGMLRHDMTGALHIPPRILISEKSGGSGTRVVYDDPVSIIAVPGREGDAVNEELKAAAEGLSGKLERLVQTIVQV